MDRSGIGCRCFAFEIHGRPLSRSDRGDLRPCGFSVDQTVDLWLYFQTAFSISLSLRGDRTWGRCIFLFSDKEKRGAEKQIHIPYPIITEFYRRTDFFISATLALHLSKAYCLQSTIPPTCPTDSGRLRK